MMATKPFALENKGLLRTKNKAQKLSAHPMGKKMRIGAQRHDGSRTRFRAARAGDMAGWTMEEEDSAMPAAALGCCETEPEIHPNRARN